MLLDHLWTIQPEMSYYFILPIIPLINSLVSSKLNLLWLIHLLTVIHLNLFVNIFKLPSDSSDFQKSAQHDFMLSLPLFIQGSTWALLLKYLNENLLQVLSKFLKTSKLMQKFYKPLFNIATLFLFSLEFESSVYNQKHRIKANVNINCLTLKRNNNLII